MAGQVGTETGGFTLPTNPARRLQELQQKQMQQPVSGQAPGPVPVPAGDDDHITDNTESNITKNITAQKDANLEISEDASTDAQTASQMPAQEVRRASSLLPAKGRRGAESQEAEKPPAKKSGRDAAQEKARKLGSTPQIPITLRLAEGLNDEVDDLAHQHRKGKVKKQDLITLAVQLLLTELGSGTDLEDLLDTYGRGGR